MKVFLLMLSSLIYAKANIAKPQESVQHAGPPEQKQPKANTEQAQALVGQNMGYFTVPRGGLGELGNTIMAQAATKPDNSNLPQKSFGNTNAKVKITIYGASTCTHCAEYDKETLPHLIKYAEEGNILLTIRSFIAHLPWDLVGSKISWAHNEKEQYNLFSKILHGQDIWLKPLFEYKTDPDAQKKFTETKIKEALEKAAHKLKKTQEEIKAVLMISADEPASLLKLFAITDLDLSLEELNKVLNDQDLEQKLLLVTLDARKDDGNLLDYTPAIYVQTNTGKQEQGVLQKVSLTYDDVVNLVAENK